VSKLPRTITVGGQDLDGLWQELLDDPRHKARLSVDADNRDVYLGFTSRFALYCLGLQLLEMALREDGATIEFSPLCPAREDGGHDELVQEGLRLTVDSSRLFVWYPRGLDEIKELQP
jgi:hypothetical protein